MDSWSRVGAERCRGRASADAFGTGNRYLPATGLLDLRDCPGGTLCRVDVVAFVYDRAASDTLPNAGSDRNFHRDGFHLHSAKLKRLPRWLVECSAGHHVADGRARNLSEAASHSERNGSRVVLRAAGLDSCSGFAAAAGTFGRQLCVGGGGRSLLSVGRDFFAVRYEGPLLSLR